MDAADQLTDLASPADERLFVNAGWLVRLRWVAVVGQLVTISVVEQFLRVETRLVALLGAVAVTASSNVLLGLWLRRCRRRARAGVGASSHIVTGVMLQDFIVLTWMLYFTGGTTNPFSIFYFVNLALSGILLPARWAWFLNGIAIVSFGFIGNFYVPVEVLQSRAPLSDGHEAGRMALTSQGLFVAFVACCSVIVYFTTRLTSELQARERDLRRAEMLRARSEKLEALGTLAAGAAHELATPLSTIAVIAKELHRELEGSVDAAALEDIAQIRSELDRCRGILDRMSVESGHVKVEPIVSVTADQIVDSVLADLSGDSHVETSIDETAKQQIVSVPLVALAQALRGLLDNAVDASGEAEPVHLRVDVDSERLRLTIRDHGCGMAPSVLARAGEPFFTTKEPEEGMGLGLFLARTVVERLGGTLQIDSVVQQGTTVVVRLPIAPDRI